MTNKENSKEYYFSDFTLGAYSKLLSFSKENYNFCDYTNFKSDIDATEPALYDAIIDVWRVMYDYGLIHG